MLCQILQHMKTHISPGIFPASWGFRMTDVWLWRWVERRHLPKGRRKDADKRTLLQLLRLTEHFPPHFIFPTSWWPHLARSAPHFPSWRIQCRCWAASRLTGVDWWSHSVDGRRHPSVKTTARGRLPHTELSIWNKHLKMFGQQWATPWSAFFISIDISPSVVTLHNLSHKKFKKPTKKKTQEALAKQSFVNNSSWYWQ